MAKECAYGKAPPTMSVDPRIDVDCVPNSGLGEAVYFDSHRRSLFGWLHAAHGSHPALLGMVICKPFGYEAVCSQRTVRALADTAASIGVPALRFDYAGTGDSADLTAGSDQVDEWTKDVAAAIAELRRRTGVTEVCLVGIRLGALVAALAAQTLPVVHSLILIAPVTSGRRYVRELRTIRLASSMSESGEVGPMGAEADHGSIEVSGFSLSGATLATLFTTDLRIDAGSPIRSILLIDDPASAASSSWLEAQSSAGIRPHYQPAAGLAQMYATLPHLAVVQPELVESVKSWLPQQHDSIKPAVSVSSLQAGPLKSAAVATFYFEEDESARHCSVTERPVFLGSDTVLFGIVAEPSSGETRRRAVVLLNAGATYHIGPNRMYVALSRHWARRGYVVLRLDLAGIGDSATRAGKADDDVFPQEALDDVRTAIGFLQTRYGVSDLTLGGICSGAYHAMHAAVADLPVNRLLMVNPHDFFSTEDPTARDMHFAEIMQAPNVFRERAMSFRSWRRLLAGEVDLWRITRANTHRIALSVASTARDVARRLGIRLPRDLGWELERIAARGVRVVFVFASDEPGIELLKLQGGASIRRLGDRCRVHVVESGDHIFSRGHARLHAQNILSRELFASLRDVIRAGSA